MHHYTKGSYSVAYLLSINSVMVIALALLTMNIEDMLMSLMIKDLSLIHIWYIIIVRD